MNTELFIANEAINVVESLSRIDKAEHGILFIVNSKNQLVGCVSDGDVRRWIIKTNDLAANVSAFMNRKPKYIFETNITETTKYFRKYPISVIPVLNSNREIVNIIFSDNSDRGRFNNRCKTLKKVDVVIMAGGKGTRLYPYTKILPKPLIPIGETPIVERIIDSFAEYGINKFYMTVNYMAGMIKSYFNELTKPYTIEYVEEKIPLGTSGSIRLIEHKFSEPFFVVNCDSLIVADFADIYDFHKKSGNDVTIVASLKKIVVPYGVLHTKERGELISMKEKPELSYFINTGMYIINPDIINLIPHNTFFHMTNLINEVMKKRGKVGMYPISEDSFLDMGEFSEMQRMEEKLKIVTE